MNVWVDKTMNIQYGECADECEFDFARFDKEGEGRENVIAYHHHLLCRIACSNYDPVKLKYFAKISHECWIWHHMTYKVAAEMYKEHLDDMCTMAMDRRRTIEEMAYSHGLFVDYFMGCEILVKLMEEQMEK